MPYNDQEISIEGGAPYFLYEFNSNEVIYRYTDYPETITYDTNDYSAFPIKHSQIKQSNEMSKNNVSITIPIQGDFASQFVGWSPDHIISVTIRRGHFGATDTLVYWKGRIASHTIKEENIELKCESIFTSLRRAGARARFQRSCRHAVYSGGCTLDKASFATTGQVSAMNVLVITVPEASAQADGYFTAGAIEFADSSFRLILSHIGDQITLNRASRYLSDNFGSGGYGLTYGLAYGGHAAHGVILYPGCDRTLATCKDKFNNILNQGGFKWIPAKNPMGGSSIV